MRRTASPARVVPAGWMERRHCRRMEERRMARRKEERCRGWRGALRGRLNGSGGGCLQGEGGDDLQHIFVPAPSIPAMLRIPSFCAKRRRFSYGNRGQLPCMRLRFDSFLCRTMETKKKNIQYGHDLVSHKAPPNRNIFVHMNKIIDFLSKIIRKFVLQVNKKDGITSSTANLVSMRR